MDRLESTIHAAVDAGVLPSDAARPQGEHRPWPVVLLIALGAWLAALPLIGVVGALLGDLLQRGVGPYIVGPLVLAGAVVVLRARGVPLFVEQLAVPALLVGGGSLGLGLFRDLPDQLASAILAGVALAIALALPRAWLRVLLGAAAATLAAVACHPGRWLAFDAFGGSWGLAWHASLGIGAVLAWAQSARLPGTGVTSLGHPAHPARSAHPAHPAHQAHEAHQAHPVSVHAAPRAVALESINAGWLLAVVAGLAWWSGMTFLAGASLGTAGQIGAELSPRAWSPMLSSLSVALALAAAAVVGLRWPPLRRPWCGAVAAVMAALAWPMPALGAVLLALAHAATTHRWRLAGAAALAAAWIAGAFYYQLAWPLQTKALVLLAAGAALGALAWAARCANVPATTPARPASPAREPPAAPSSADAAPARMAAGSLAGTAHAGAALAVRARDATSRNATGRDATTPDATAPGAGAPDATASSRAAHSPSRMSAALVALAGIAVLVVANVGIVQRERLIADGRPVFVPLAPVDPRSLLQGDYMRLAYALPAGAERADLARAAMGERPRVVAQLDERGIATLLRLDDGTPLAPSQLHIELTPKDGRWVVASDAWFFPEGEAQRWQRARYAEFRIAPNGQALLVDLRGPSLEKL